MAGAWAASRAGVVAVAETGVPSPAAGIGARPASLPRADGGAAGTGGGGGTGAVRDSVMLRLPNTRTYSETIPETYFDLFTSLPSSGENRLLLAFLTSERPVR